MIDRGVISLRSLLSCDIFVIDFRIICYQRLAAHEHSLKKKIIAAAVFSSLKVITLTGLNSYSDNREEVLAFYAFPVNITLLICIWHYDNIIMGAMGSQITSLTIVYSTVYSSADQSKHQSSVSLAFVWVIHLGPVNSPHKWPVTRKMFPFDDIMVQLQWFMCPPFYLTSGTVFWDRLVSFPL